MNKFYKLYILIIAILFTGCQQEKELIAVTEITLSHTSVELTVGDQHRITAEISPKNAGNTLVLWTSSQTSVASVQDGIITAHKEGRVTITAKML